MTEQRHLGERFSFSGQYTVFAVLSSPSAVDAILGASLLPSFVICLVYELARLFLVFKIQQLYKNTRFVSLLTLETPQKEKSYNLVFILGL